MRQRDLTSNAPANNNIPEIVEENPFGTPVNESSSSESNQSYGYSRGNSGGYHGYHGYQSDSGTASNLVSYENSLNEAGVHTRLIGGGLGGSGVHRPNTPTNIQVPSEYDRYPSMAGSRVVSSTSLAHQSSHAAPGSFTPLSEMENDRRSESDKSPTGALLGTDFSPFGGYPASAFPLHIDEKEDDDYLHNPDPIADAQYDKHRFFYDLKNIDRRSLSGLIGIIFLFLAAIAVFILLPVLTFSGVTSGLKPETYEILSNYKYPLLSAIRTELVDPDTPEDALTKKVSTGDTWKLVFSDEFDAEGRTFYEGDDQFFTAVDLWYGGTKDLEWYDPDAASTANGTLNLRMDAYKNHDLFYRSGMVQSWNKMCFTQGMLEISARLPGYGDIPGLWPGLWSMGNLGRPGYMATTDGVWPYTYNECDVGITANQSSPDGISYLPGQKLNKCTCSGEDHPNPGTGRGAPEIDAVEGTIDPILRVPVVSQSMQIAPMDIWYIPDYNFIEIHDKDVTAMNSYTGGPIQQALSGTTVLNTTWYEKGEGMHNFQIYGFEFLNDQDNGYCTWYVGEEPTFTLHSYALAPNGNVGWRQISKEPMSVVMNLGISNNWVWIDWANLNFPFEMRVDYVRVYQPNNAISVTCDPDDYPTTDYISNHPEPYANTNLTSWEDAGFVFPKNKLVHGCS